MRPSAQTAAPCPVCSLCSWHSSCSCSPDCFLQVWGWPWLLWQCPGLDSISHESCRLLAGLSTAPAFPCLRKNPCAPGSAAPLWIGLAPEQLPSAVIQATELINVFCKYSRNLGKVFLFFLPVLGIIIDSKKAM